ncbi:SDR family oxidoreductase [Microbacterium marinilacus]|uniref:SDR family oxidoreductase n=1 Tax=Microbacterium marinilacus TaxID=415209 RepID=A0ABP7BR21_9MICO|nr:SDR family oxidoreductase [Microbacterium marinilacus]MBY0689847.1 SDR family oxidoreductase [Microbacterium marinilacus]
MPDHEAVRPASEEASLPLRGRTALVTGVSRPRGIGFAVARRLALLGADVVVHHHAPHDADFPWGGADVDAVRRGLGQALVPGARSTDIAADLVEDGAAEHVVDEARRLTGRLDVLVCNHARAGHDASLLDASADVLDGHWRVNTRATLLMTRRFAEQFVWDGDEHSTGRAIWMTSGQLHGPMPGEVAYAARKAALAGVTQTVAAELVRRGILLNTVNPGPVNTGYLDPETSDRPDALDTLREAMPLGRFGHPDDPARLIGWLASDEGRWVVGETLSSDGGFRLG